MKNASLDLLEFAELKRLVGRYVSSHRGRAELEKIAPSTDRAAIEEALAEAGEAIEYLRAASQPQPARRGAAIRLHFDSLPEHTEAVQRLFIEGSSLEGREILDLTEWLERASDARMVLTATAERFPRLAGRASLLGEFRGLLRDLSGKLQPDGTVADHASVALNRLRRDIERQQRLIQESLERFLRIHREEGILQEQFVAIRNERFVVPLIAGQRRKIDGVIHAASGSGHTLFVEPMETIDLNNELVRLTEEEQREVHRILREMTERLRAHAEAVSRTLQVMGELDLVFAKAQFALDFGGVIPRFGDRLRLRDARHPLLEDVLRRQRKPVVPLSLTLEGAGRTLLISGPNTGGKTVSLKTVGLLALMAQSGLPVPAAEAEFPLFRQVLADIGDNQSIQESLSTFSAHVARVGVMVEAVTPDSLALLDELGRATDPEEGGALGIAVLERFRESGAYTLASTHLLALKVFGATTEGVISASMGFDDASLQPTYVLRAGAPGKSAGLDIASRLGLPPGLIERARGAMSSSERDIARFLAELHRRLAEVTVLEDDLRRQRAEAAARAESAAKESARREALKIQELERRSTLMMERFEAQAKETIESILHGSAQRKAAEQALRRAVKTRRDFEHELEATVLEVKGESHSSEVARPKVEEGARVRLRDVREPARVLRKLPHDQFEVQAGFMKMKIGLEDVLEVLPESGVSAALPRHVTFEPGPKWDVSYREINVIGQRAEEACDSVDKFLDSAALASVDRVRIIHGHGMGILRKALAEFLARHPHVERFYPAPQSEGGAGATIAELK